MDNTAAKQAIHINRCYKNTFTGKEGEDVLHDLIKAANVMTSSFTPDPYETAFNEGARSIVLRIIDMVNIDPNKFIKLIEESTEDEGGFDE